MRRVTKYARTLRAQLAERDLKLGITTDQARRRLVQLTAQCNTMRTYLLDKVMAEDWHGVGDAANDLRELRAEIDCLVCVLAMLGEPHHDTKQWASVVSHESTPVGFRR